MNEVTGLLIFIIGKTTGVFQYNVNEDDQVLQAPGRALYAKG